MMNANPLFAIDLAPHGQCADAHGNIAAADLPRFSADLKAAEAALKGRPARELREFVEACGLFAPVTYGRDRLRGLAHAALVHLWWARDERAGVGFLSLPSLRRPARAES